MLEAMASGMPVVSISSPTSPIIDGKNGFISSDLYYLKDKLKLLLDNLELAKSVGQRDARQ
jgi:glycosyltransferase involved in cell wall biosynthesis